MEDGFKSKENRGHYGTASFGVLIFTVVFMLPGYEEVEWGLLQIMFNSKQRQAS
jgi:hypothetical protein